MMEDFKKYIKFEDYENYLEPINRANNHGLYYLALTNFLISLLNFVILALIGTPGVIMNFIFVLANLILFYGARCLCRYQHLDYTPLCYTFMIPCFLMPLISELALHKQAEGVAYLCLLIVIPIFILDRPKRVLLVISLYALLYLAATLAIEDHSNLPIEIMHLLDAYGLSLLANSYSLSIRIRNVELGEHFEKKSEHDPLTGLYNRDGGVRYINPHCAGVLIFIDVDNFKHVNDGYGHAKGDDVLREFAKTLQKNFRDDDIIMRYGGDEFAVYTRGDWDELLMEKRLNELLYDLRKISVTKEGQSPLYMTASIGCLIAKYGCQDLDTMLRLADQKMYEAKEHGKNSYRILVQD